MARRTTRKAPYKRRTTQRKNPSPVKWLLGGMLIGVILPSYFLLKHHSSSNDYTANKEKEVVAAQSHELTKHVVKKVQPKEEATTHAKYEFYNLLSSEEEPSAKNVDGAPTPSSQYILKIAALKTFEEADQLKAQLSLIGMDHINISKSSLNSRYPFKVIIGPFSSRTEALKIKKELKDNDISGEIVEN